MSIRGFSNILRFFLCLGLGLGSAFVSATALGKPSKAVVQEILSDGKKLFAREGGGEDRSAAEYRLALRPKPLLLEVLREQLTTAESGPASIALRIALVLKLKELIPDIERRVSTRDEWEPVVTLTMLADEQAKPRLEKLYLERLSAVSSEVTKVAFLDGLTKSRTALPFGVYQSHIAFKSSDVRRAAFEQFLASRDGYSIDDQKQRFALAFNVPTFQGQLRAFKAFLALSESERKQLASAVSPTLCKDQSHEDVKSVCLSVQRALGRRPAKEGS